MGRDCSAPKPYTQGEVGRKLQGVSPWSFLPNISGGWSLPVLYVPCALCDGQGEHAITEKTAPPCHVSPLHTQLRRTWPGSLLVLYGVMLVGVELWLLNPFLYEGDLLPVFENL